MDETLIGPSHFLLRDFGKVEPERILTRNGGLLNLFMECGTLRVLTYDVQRYNFAGI